MALITIKVLDHFQSSDTNMKEFILEFIGRYIGMNDNYVSLATIIPIFGDGSSVIVDNKSEFSNVLRKTIIGKTRLYLETKDDLDEITKIAEKLNAEIINQTEG